MSYYWSFKITFYLKLNKKKVDVFLLPRWFLFLREMREEKATEVWMADTCYIKAFSHISWSYWASLDWTVYRHLVYLYIYFSLSGVRWGVQGSFYWSSHITKKPFRHVAVPIERPGHGFEDKHVVDGAAGSNQWRLTGLANKHPDGTGEGKGK